MSALKKGRYFLVSTMAVGFLYIVGQSLVKYTDRSIGETQSTKRATEMVFPSLYTCPFFKGNFSRNKFSTSKNLTEYYESRPRITDFVLSISQSYEADNK